MIVCGLDLATRSGVCVLDGTKVLHCEAFRPAGKVDAEIFHGFRNYLRPLLLSHSVEYVGLEQPLPTDIEVKDKRPGVKVGEKRNPITMVTYLRLYGLRAHAIEVCHALSIPHLEIHQGTWRKAFTGNGRATKDDVLALARQLVPTLKSKDASDALGVAWALNGELNKPKEADLFAGAA